MRSQFDFDNSLDSESLSSDRKVLNKSDDSKVPGLIFHSGNDSKENQTSVSDGGISSIEFTDTSSRFYEPFEDMDLLNGKTQPSISGSTNYYNSSFEHKIYDPSKDSTTGFGYVDLDSMNRKTGDKFSKESFGLPDFFTNPIDLIIICIILIAIIIIEVIGLIAIL